MNAVFRTVLFGLFSLVIIGFVALMAWGLSNKTSVTGLSGITRLQKPAPPFTLELFDGEELELASAQGRPIVINFWASWCAPCRIEAPALEKAWRSFRDEDVLYVGIDIQDTDEAGRTHVDEFGITYPNGRDKDGRISVDYGVIGIPTTFFISKEGVVERRWVGEIDPPRLLSWTNDLEAGVAASGEVDGVNEDGFYGLDGLQE